jgi:WD40 repeat protein
MPAETCPSLDELRRCARGETRGAAARSLARHTESCPACRAALLALSPECETILGPAAPAGGEVVTVPCPPPDPAPEDWPTVPGYKIVGVLGRGGMGVVYKARQVEAGRLVALKMILAGAHAGPADLARFRAEAEAIARLQHPNIVQVFEVGRHGGLPFFSLEFCGGGSLRRRLDQTVLPPREAAALVEQLARAMHAAHQKGVVHRDLKPANILLASGGGEPPDARSGGLRPPLAGLTPKISDFGVAKRLGDAGLTLTGAVVGTPSYMAPEQARGRGEEVGPAADVWALGAILYECLAGRAPFRAATALETLEQVCTQEPVPPRSLNPPVPRDLDTVCLKCLRKEPGRRYGSALELAEDLRRWLGGEPVRARPVGGPERAVKWALRRPASAALMAVSALAAAALLTGAAWFTEELQGERDAAESARGEAARKADEAEAGRRLLRRHLYAAQVRLASDAWQDANVGRLRELLDAQRPADNEEDLRGFEWHYLSRLLTAELFTFRGHDRPVHCVAYAPDGRCVASGADDGVIKVWGPDGGQEFWTARRASAVRSLAFSPDGTVLAACGWSDEVSLYDAATGAARGTVAAPAECHAVAYNRDGTRLATACADGVLRLWDAATGRLALAARADADLWDVAFSPDGKRVAGACQDGAVRVWETAGGRLSLVLRGHSNPLRGVAFSPDGTRIASTGLDQTVRLWDARTGQPLHVLRGHSGFTGWVAFSPDGRRLASGGTYDQTVRVWDADSGRELFALRGHGGEVNGLAFSPDGRRLVSAGWDHTVKVWDATRGLESLDLPSPSFITAGVAFDAGGARLVSATDWGVKVHDLRGGPPPRCLRGHAAHVRGVACAGGRIASASQDGTVKVWDADSGHLLHTLAGHDGGVAAVALSPDARLLASASDDRTVRVWDVCTATESLRLAHRDPVAAVAFAPGGELMASGGGVYGVCGELKVWDPRTGREALSHTDLLTEVSAVAFSPDGSRLAYAVGNAVKVVESATGRELLSLCGHTAAVRAVAFSPDGLRLASASQHPVVKLWDLRTGAEVLELAGHTGWVYAVAFSPDGRRLASAGDGWVVKLWDTGPPPAP